MQWGVDAGIGQYGKRDLKALSHYRESASPIYDCLYIPPLCTVLILPVSTKKYPEVIIPISALTPVALGSSRHGYAVYGMLGRVFVAAPKQKTQTPKNPH